MQGICEDSHSIRTEVEEVEEEGGRVRVERDVVTASRSCHTKQVNKLGLTQKLLCEIFLLYSFYHF